MASGIDNSRDLRDPGAVGRAAGGATMAVHGAAWHGIHLKEHRSRDFSERNVDGTFTLSDRRQCGVRGDQRLPATLD